MTSILNATTTNGVQLTPDNSGALQLQTGGVAALTISNAQQITLANPLGVASGGIGAASLAANAVLLGNGAGTPQTVAPGTSGNALLSNGTTWASVPISTVSGNVQTFTSSGTWTKPSIGTIAVIEIWGAGGGGGLAGGTACCPLYSNGAAGGYSVVTCLLSDLTSTVTVTVGAGGAGLSTVATTAGSTTSFGGYLSAGGGGTSNNLITAVSGLTVLSYSVSNAQPWTPTNGGSSITAAVTSIFGGTGGAYSATTNGGNGGQPGAGGGATSHAGSSGGAGAAGKVRVTVI